MRIRIISGIIGTAIMIPVLIFSDTWLFPAFTAFVTFLSTFEMLRCIGVHKKYYLSIPVMLFAAAAPIVARLSEDFEKLDIVFVLLTGAVSFAFYLLAISLFSKGDFLISDAAMVFMTEFYIIGGYTSVVLLRDFQPLGNYIYLLVLIGAWSTDIFAYFTGRAFGKHKLIPDISPKKTVEGSIGGIVFCALAYIGYGFILQNFFSIKPNYIILACVAVVVSVVSQIGDLTMSQIKRKYGIKDYGNIMPGHGGALDRFDSVLAVSLLLIIACGIIKSLGYEILYEVI